MATVEVCMFATLNNKPTLHNAQTFESTLKEVVRAKRLSASKVKELTDIALKTMKVRNLMLVPRQSC